MRSKVPKRAWIEILLDNNGCTCHRVVRHRFGKKIEREFNVFTKEVDECIEVYSYAMNQAKEEFEIVRRDVN